MSVTSLILGLDVSPRRLGWGLVSLIDGSPVACGMEPIDLPDHGWQHQQIKSALKTAVMAQACPSCTGYGSVSSSWGTAEYGGGSLGTCSACKGRGRTSEIQAVYIEQPWLSPRSGTKSAYSAGRAVQAAQAEVERRWPWAPIEYLQPAEWKLLAGLKGNASKAEVLAFAARLMDVPDENIPAIASQDECDALLIAVAGWHRNEDVMEQAAALSRRGA